MEPCAQLDAAQNRTGSAAQTTCTVLLLLLTAHLLQQYLTLEGECSGDTCVTCSGTRCACCSSPPSFLSCTLPCTSQNLVREQLSLSGSGRSSSASVVTLFCFLLPRLCVLA